MDAEERAIYEAERNAGALEYIDTHPEEAHRHRRHPQEEVEEEYEDPEEVEAVSSHLQEINTRPSTQRAAVSTLSRSTTAMELRFMEYLDRHPTARKRIIEHRLQHASTVGSIKALDENYKLPPFGDNKPYPPPLPDADEYVVEFDGPDDPLHPQNWSLNKKLGMMGILIFDSIIATFSSSIFSPAGPYFGAEFGQGQESQTLATSLFVLGYAVGPSIFSPISELYGRKPPLLITAFAVGIFSIAVAVAKDYQTLMICRFFTGFFGSCALTVVPAVFADIFDNKVRGIAVGAYGAALFCGPFMGPIIGGFITKSYLGWRWDAYIPAFMAFAACILILFFLEESYGPVVLVAKASDLRRRTRNWGIHAKQEEVEIDVAELARKNLARPLKLLFTEPIILLVTFYLSFVYGLLYVSLTAYAIIFGEIHGFSPGVSGLPYIGMIVGAMLGFLASVLEAPSYVRKLEANDGIPVPEWRMPLCAAGGIFFAAGLFWLGWTGFDPSIHWIVPTLSGLFIAFGIFTIFMANLNYLIDAYLMFAASAVAANTIMRSLFGAVFPLWASYMFEGIGIQWGMTFLGCMACLFIPVPFIFMKYGKAIRSRSKVAPALDIEHDKRRDEESRGADGNETGSSNETAVEDNARSNSHAQEKEE